MSNKDSSTPVKNQVVEASAKNKQYYKHINIIRFAFQNFKSNQCYFHASALTYYTIFSIVPILALFFGISKGFGLEKNLQIELYNKFPEQKIVIDKLIYWANVYLLQETKGSLITGVGVAVLFYIVIKAITNIEKTFNTIWHVKKARSFIRKFTDYLSLLMICPILLVLFESMTVFLSTEASTMLNIPPIIHALITILIPYLIIWLLFTVVFYFLPNTKVNLKPAIIAAILAGTAFTFEQWLYIQCQFAFTKYNAVYGSFAALPLFLIEVQLAWMIVLTGAELCYAMQNIEDFDHDGLLTKLNNKQKKILMVSVLSIIAKRFYYEKPLATLEDLSKTLKIPIRLTKNLTSRLIDVKLIAVTQKKFKKRVNCFQPAHSVDKLSINFVLGEIDGVPDVKLIDKTFENLGEVTSVLDSFYDQLENFKNNKMLIDLDIAE